jgi:hypothetical protein
MSDDDRKYHYAVTNLDAMNMWLAGEHVFSDNKVMKLTKEQHEELQALMKKGNRPDITQNLQYIDVAAAEEVARKHLAQTRPNASQGAHNSSTTAEGNKAGLQAAPKVVVPDPTPGRPQTLAERIQAQQAGKIDPNAHLTKDLTSTDHLNAGPGLTSDQEARKVLNATAETVPGDLGTPANPIEEAAFHPEDDAAAAAALEAANKK